MERSREKAAAHGGRKEPGGGMGGAGGRHGQGYAGASARGDGIDGHISHSSVSRRDHRTWLRGGSAWSAVADFADICRWGDTSCDKDCPRHKILSGCWATMAEAPWNLGLQWQSVSVQCFTSGIKCEKTSPSVCTSLPAPPKNLEKPLYSVTIRHTHINYLQTLPLIASAFYFHFFAQDKLARNSKCCFISLQFYNLSLLDISD